MKLKTRIGFVTILVLMMSFPLALADQNQTVNIVETQDDGYLTEAGIGIDGPLIALIDPSMDIRAYFVFENIEINNWEVVTNATLRLTSSQTLDFDNDSSVTVYGMKQSDLGGILTNSTRLAPGEIWSMPLTSAFTNVNTSQFQGGATIDINVTEIVIELISDAHWDGDGNAGTELGDDMGFIILGAPDEGRFCYDYRGDPVRSADLILHWGHSPPPPSAGGVYNETYRDLNIWELDHLGENRTGTNAEVNWNLLNMTMLTELDSGAALTLNNDTSLTISALQAQQWAAMYNDTGAANINSFFVRFAINTTSVTNNLGAGTDRVMALCSVATVTPVGGAGLLDNNAGNWAGLIMQLHADDIQYNFRLIDRAGAAFHFDGSTLYYSEADGELLFFEVYIYDDGAASHYMTYRMYDDPEFTNLLDTEADTIDQGRGPWRYPQVVSSLGAGTSLVNDAEFYTFDEMPVADNSTWIVTFQNGTQIGNATDYDGAIIIADIFLGPDPTDPAPPSQGWEDTGVLTRYRTRLYIWFLGVLMIFGPLSVMAYKRPTGYQFVIGAFIMLVGLGFLIAAGAV